MRIVSDLGDEFVKEIQEREGSIRCKYFDKAAAANPLTAKLDKSSARVILYVISQQHLTLSVLYIYLRFTASTRR